MQEESTVLLEKKNGGFSTKGIKESLNPDPDDLKKKGKVHRSLTSVLTLEFY